MSSVTFDIEANGFLDDATEIHCISISENDGEPKCFSGERIPFALKHIESAEKLIGHNIIGYDLPLLKKLCNFTPRQSVDIRDTYIIAQMVWPDIMGSDSDTSTKILPKKYWGRYSLRSFGYRFRMHKGDMEDFTQFSPEMEEYCNQDVRITLKLWAACVKRGCTTVAVDLEMAFAHLAHLMNEKGIGFDTERAYSLYETVNSEREEILATISTLVPPRQEVLKTPEYWVDPITDVQYQKKGDAPAAARKDLVRGPNRVKVHAFNPLSRQQVAQFLISKGWIPTATTPTGKPRVDESILQEIPEIEEAQQIARLYRLQKLLAMLHDGKEGWLKLVKNNRLHPRLKTVGTVSGRTSCVSPNLQQVPSPRLTYGKECRELFYAEDGRMLVGVDAKSLEVRCFAHYLSLYDSGEFAADVISGDIHAANAKMMACDRQVAKNTFFALIYGASRQKIAKMLGYTLDEATDLVSDLYERRPAMKKLMTAVKDRALSYGYLKGLDGRRLYPRSIHSSVNLLIQAAGACVSKQAALNTHQTLVDHWMDVYDIGLVGFIHDEIIVDVPEDTAEAIVSVGISSFKKTTGQLELRCPMDGDGRIGKTWYDIH